MAPGAARWPEEICAPSKAGPVGEEQASRRCAVAEHDLGIGADIDEERELVAGIGRLGEDHAGGVGADMAGDAAAACGRGARRDGEAEVARRTYRAPGRR